MSSDLAPVLEATRRAIRAARELVPQYAGSRAPVRTDQLVDLLRRTACHLEVFPFLSDAVAMTLPRCEGVYPVLVNRDAEHVDRLFALRHEMAHVLAGEVDGAVFLANEGYMSTAERAADLFALADLIPTWVLRWVCSEGGAPEGILEEVRAAVQEYAERWPAQRLDDRARLRLALFGEFGI